MILLFIVTLALVHLCMKIWYNLNYWKRLKIPYCKPIPLVGNCLDLILFKQAAPNFILNLCQKMKNKPMFGIWFFTEPCLVVQDIGLIKTIMVKDYSYFPERAVHYSPKVDPNFNLGVFFLPHAQWKEVRSKLSPSFTPAKSKKYFELIAEKARKLVIYINQKKCADQISKSENIEKSADKISNENLHNINDLLKFSTNITPMFDEKAQIFEYINGHSVINQNQNFNENVESGNINRQREELIKRTLGESIGHKRKILEMYSFSKIFVIECLMSIFFGLDMNGFNENLNPIKELTDELFGFKLLAALCQQIYFVKSELVDFFKIPFVPKKLTKKLRDYLMFSLEEREKSGQSQGDFIDFMLSLRTEIGEDLACAQSIGFFVAGFLTTTSTISFALHELSCNLDCQEIVRNEIQTTLRKYGLSYDSLQKMRYFEAVIMETMRKYPALPFFDRKASEDYQFPGCDFTLKKGTKVLIPLMGVNYNPEYFPEPEKFNPGRFLGQDGSKIEAAMPFGLGPRLCVGKQFGLLMVKIVLVHLLLEFEFTRCPETLYPIVFEKKSAFIESINKIPLYVAKISGEK